MQDEVLSPKLELIGVAYSPYYELVRWALELKGLTTRQQIFFPGMHAPPSDEPGEVPLAPTLRVEDHYLTIPAQVIEFIEIFQPFPTLFPSADQDYLAALDVQRRFLEDWGPQLQRLVLVKLLEHPEYCVRFWSGGHAPAECRFYEHAFSLAKKSLVQGCKLRARAHILRKGEKVLNEIDDYLKSQLKGRNYLHGERFSISDMIAASFLAPFAQPEQCALSLAAPIPEELAAWVDRNCDGFVMEWARWIYSQHRGAVKEPPQRSAVLSPY